MPHFLTFSAYFEIIYKYYTRFHSARHKEATTYLAQKNNTGLRDTHTIFHALFVSVQCMQLQRDALNVYYIKDLGGGKTQPIMRKDNMDKCHFAD